jgi:hypothetical protein
MNLIYFSDIQKSTQGVFMQKLSKFSRVLILFLLFNLNLDLNLCSAFAEPVKNPDPYTLFSQYLQNDDPKLLVDNGELLLTELDQMAARGLTSATLTTQPWSDAYWPLQSGNIAWRYADPRFPKSEDFIKNYNYIWLAPHTVTGSSNPKNYDTLSPAEKYDLLIGDSNRNLTAAALRPGKRIYDDHKNVESWVGICHGWAPASYMLDRPRNSITVTAADGITRINFYPSDIKALSSYLWANLPFRARFIGGRCKVSNPARNNTGRIIDPNCYDTNPGTWHLSVVNQIGVSNRSLIMDSTYDYEVWNQPIYSYKYSYFNPKTNKNEKNLSEATLSLNDFRNDKFAKFRSPYAKYVVGISMTVIYIGETYPTKSNSDSSNADRKVKTTYLYDLELDASGKIIGGEWYQSSHPDFLWTPKKDTHLLTTYDKEIEKSNSQWRHSEPLPKEWADYARQASRNESLPLSKIIDELISRSNSK